MILNAISIKLSKSRFAKFLAIAHWILLGIQRILIQFTQLRWDWECTTSPPPMCRTELISAWISWMNRKYRKNPQFENTRVSNGHLENRKVSRVDLALATRYEQHYRLIRLVNFYKQHVIKTDDLEYWRFQNRKIKREHGDPGALISCQRFAQPRGPESPGSPRVILDEIIFHSHPPFSI